MPVTVEAINALTRAHEAHDLLESKLRDLDGVCVTRRTGSWGQPELEIKLDHDDLSKVVFGIEMEVHQRFPYTPFNVIIV